MNSENDKPKSFKPNLKNSNPDEIGTQFAAQRTALSFQRTRLSADRTLMSVIRTSLSLIGFGFTIFQFFRSLRKIRSDLSLTWEPRVFGLSLTSLGIGMLALGIIYHIRFMLQVRKEREALKEDGLLPKQDEFPVSMTLIVAAILLLFGMLVAFNMVFQLI